MGTQNKKDELSTSSSTVKCIEIPQDVECVYFEEWDRERNYIGKRTMKWCVHHSSVWSKWVWLNGELSSIMEIPRVVAKWKMWRRETFLQTKQRKILNFRRSFRLSSENENQVSSLNYQRMKTKNVVFILKGKMMRGDTAFCISLLPYDTKRKEIKEEDSERHEKREDRKDDRQWRQVLHVQN